MEYPFFWRKVKNIIRQNKKAALQEFLFESIYGRREVSPILDTSSSLTVQILEDKIQSLHSKVEFLEEKVSHLETLLKNLSNYVFIISNYIFYNMYLSIFNNK